MQFPQCRGFGVSLKACPALIATFRTILDSVILIHMFGLSPLELGIIGLLIVLLFGTKRLPELGSGLGQAIQNFKKSYKDAEAIDVTPKNDKAEGDKQQNNPK